MIPVTAKTKRTHKPCLQVAWRVQVYDKNNKLVEEKSGQNSLLVGFAVKIAGLLFDTVSTLQDITNTSRPAYTMYPQTLPNGMPCANGLTSGLTYGIVVGTNNTAVSADDYVLNTIVDNGVSAGKLMYMLPGIMPVVTGAPVSSFKLNRVMINHSGGTITIKELGIYALEGSANATICLCRDIIANPGVDIIDGNYMFVQYTISVTT